MPIKKNWFVFKEVSLSRKIHFFHTYNSRLIFFIFAISAASFYSITEIWI